MCENARKIFVPPVQELINLQKNMLPFENNYLIVVQACA